MVPLTQPLPASTILQTLLSSRNQPCHGRGRGSKRISVGYAEIDEYVLQGGVERGVVLGVSADVAGEGCGRILSLHLLASTLLSCPSAKASVIDTTGSFPISLLAKVFHSRLASLHQQDWLPNTESTERVEAGVEQKTQGLLQRVEISRAFDIEGVLEVLSEISHRCSRRSNESPGKGVSVGSGEEILTASKPKVAKEERGRIVMDIGEESKNVEIPDSEGDDDESDEGDFELSPQKVSHTIRGTQDPICDNPTSDTNARGNMDMTTRGNTELVIVDNMTMPIHELFSRKEKNEAHALLLYLSREFHSLTETHSILAILLNSLINPRQSSPSSDPHLRRRSSPVRQHQISSIFTSTTERPSLGRLFSDLVALHVLITRVPKSHQDTRTLHASVAGSPSSSPASTPSRPSVAMRDGGVQYCHVLEVLKDEVHDLEGWEGCLGQRHQNRYGWKESATTSMRQGGGSSGSSNDGERRERQNRQQRWAPFKISADGLRFLDVHFSRKGTEDDMREDGTRG